MKTENVNPFIQSISDVFQSMLECTVEAGSPSGKADRKTEPDVVGVIGLSGTAQGIVAIRFPEKTALAVIGKMVRAEFKSVDSSIIDGVGELVNIVAGNAKGKLEGHSISLSLPTVVRGDICKLSNLQNTIWLEVPFASTLGDFSLAVSFKPAVVTEKEALHESIGSR